MSVVQLGLRKGQCQVKLGQIRSNFQIQTFLQNIPILSMFVPGFQKMLFIFTCDNKKCQKFHWKKWRHHIYLLFYHCTGKNKGKLLWNLVRVLLFVCIFIRHISVLSDNFKILDFICTYFWKKSQILVLGIKIEKCTKVWDSHL